MKAKRIYLAIAAALTALLAGVLTAAGGAFAGGASAAVGAAAPYCGITWGSADRTGGALSGAPLLAARAGQHECFDRLVFEFDGPATGYRVAYGEVYTDGEGLALSPYTAGDATLSVVLFNPAHDGSYRPTFPHRSGDHVANLLRFQTLRDVVFGGTFEGYTTFAVGVRARLPYQVSVLSGPGTHSRIVLDVAHAWQA